MKYASILLLLVASPLPAAEPLKPNTNVGLPSGAKVYPQLYESMVRRS